MFIYLYIIIHLALKTLAPKKVQLNLDELSTKPG